VSLFSKAVSAVVEKGPKEGAKFVWERARTYFVDGNRELVLLRVDLTDPKNHVRAKDQAAGFELVEMSANLVPRIVGMLKSTEPARAPNVPDRLRQGMSGLVALVDGEIAAYVFFVPGSDDPARTVHPDLQWLPIRPAAGEVYTFDYFVPESRRGLGNLFARAVQQRQHEMGFTASYGYVYAANRAGLWLYRTIGWKEVGRIKEHKVLLKLAVVGDRLFWIRQYDRRLICRVPVDLA
jgi:hypothetical protein